MNLVELIKKIALDVVEESCPTQVEVGKVIGVKPLKVLIDPKKILDEDFLTYSNMVFSEGETLILIRLKGGQKYLVLSKFKEKEEDFKGDTEKLWWRNFRI